MPLMKAAVVRAYREALSLEEVPVPEVPAGQILVKVAACGVCTPTSLPPNATGRSSRPGWGGTSWRSRDRGVRASRSSPAAALSSGDVPVSEERRD